MKNPKVILLVEDNPDDIEWAGRALRKYTSDSQVVVAEDGAEALDYLFGTGVYEGRDMNVTPSLILLDLKLPKIQGLEVLRRLRADKRTQLIPVVILTASEDEEDLIEGYDLGCNSYLRKPVNFAMFIENVGQVGRYWLRMNEPPPAVTEIK